MEQTLSKIAAGALTASLVLGLGASAASAHTLSLAPTLEVGGSADVSAGGVRVRAAAQASTTANAQLRARERANQELMRRLNALAKIATRISDMKRVSGDDKAALSASVQGQIDALNALKVKIDSDDSTTTLKDDVQSITASYRVYALVLPQAAITAAADRVSAVVSLMQSFSAKLSAVISAAAQGGADVSASQTALADYNAKVADAKMQADAAASLVANLKPDNGDQSVMQSNTAALKDAHAKIQAAHQDLVAARKDITAIRKDLPKGSVAATSTAKTTTSAGVNE